MFLRLLNHFINLKITKAFVFVLLFCLISFLGIFFSINSNFVIYSQIQDDKPINKNVENLENSSNGKQPSEEQNNNIITPDETNALPTPLKDEKANNENRNVRINKKLNRDGSSNTGVTPKKNININGKNLKTLNEARISSTLFKNNIIEYIPEIEKNYIKNYKEEIKILNSKYLQDNENDNQNKEKIEKIENKTTSNKDKQNKITNEKEVNEFIQGKWKQGLLANKTFINGLILVLLILGLFIYRIRKGGVN